VVGSLWFHYIFTAESDGERIWNIGRQVAKLLARIKCSCLCVPLFAPPCMYIHLKGKELAWTTFWPGRKVLKSLGSDCFDSENVARAFEMANYVDGSKLSVCRDEIQIRRGNNRQKTTHDADTALSDLTTQGSCKRALSAADQRCTAKQESIGLNGGRNDITPPSCC